MINLVRTQDKKENKILNEEKYEYKIQINNKNENFLTIDNYFGELKEEYPIGLDIGNNYCRIGVYRNGGVEMIPNSNGEVNTPSIVTILDENTILKGEETLNYLESNYEDSIYGIKRFIGREYNDKLKKEIESENFPFKIIEYKKEKYPLISINKNNKLIQYTLEEIIYFLIKKMIDNAEAYLNRKINKLVITVPCSFNDSQRNSIKMAAELVGLKDVRIINEPIAAALAYNYKNIISYPKVNGQYKEKKILVLDIGGKNANATVLKINYNKEEKFEILSSKDDKYLGGENFDNKLVDYYLDKFCRENRESKENILKYKQAYKRLKIDCVNIKKTLSKKDEAHLKILNFYGEKDIYLGIARIEFEELCNELFEKIINLIKDVLNNAKINKEEINEIIFSGGSSKIPKIKKILNEFFEINNKAENNKVIINDLINPSEVISYGATVMAQYIFHKNSEFLCSNVFDIIPLSLGVNIKNQSKNEDIIKEGDLMKVIIKRGTKIPCSNMITYTTYEDNQKEIKINIFEGENQYVKYNHELGEIIIKDLPEKRKGEIKIYLKFIIHINGILTIIAKENDNLHQFQINNYMNLLETDIIKLKEKYEKLFPKEINKYLDFTNLKESLKKLKNAYEESGDDNEKYNIIKCYTEMLEDFINLFDKEFDNETLLEKYYIYVKELINSFIRILNMEKQITKDDSEYIKNKIIKNILIFINKNSGYLNDLVEMIQILPKNSFFEIIAKIIEKLNNSGKNCLKERTKFCSYQSLTYFEKSYLLSKKYFLDINIKVLLITRNIIDNFKRQISFARSYIKDIKSNKFPLNEQSLKSNNLFSEDIDERRYYNPYDQISSIDEEEKYKLILNNYENILIELQDKICKEQAICIGNILKLSIRFLGEENYRKYIKLGEYCKYIVNYLKLNKNENWYKEFEEIFTESEYSYSIYTKYENENRIKIKNKYKEIFEEIELQFIMRKNDSEFIKYILYLQPYNGFEEDLKNKDFINISNELIEFLRDKYTPYNNAYDYGNEESLLKYFIIEDIKLYLDEINNIIH